MAVGTSGSPRSPAPIIQAVGEISCALSKVTSSGPGLPLMASGGGNTGLTVAAGGGNMALAAGGGNRGQRK